MEYTVYSFPEQSPALRFLGLIHLGRNYLPPCQTKSLRMLWSWNSGSLLAMTKYSSLDSLYRSNLLSRCLEGREAKVKVLLGWFFQHVMEQVDHIFLLGLLVASFCLCMLFPLSTLCTCQWIKLPSSTRFTQDSHLF